MRQLARFLVVRRQVVDHYDKLTKAVYLRAMQAECNAYAIAEDRPKNAPRLLIYHSQANGLNSGFQAVPSRAWAVGKETGATRQWSIFSQWREGQGKRGLGRVLQGSVHRNCG